MAFSQATKNRKLKNRMKRESSSKARSAGNLGGSLGGGDGRLAFRGGLLGPSHRRQGPVSSSRVILSSIRSTGDPTSRIDLVGDSSSSIGPHALGVQKMHLGICYMDLLIWYGCGLRGHIQRDCRSSRQGVGRSTARPISTSATTSATPPPGHGSARGGIQSLGRPSRLYAMQSRRSSEASPEVVTGILAVQSHDV
ncbi:uncharacterized protein [Nicotiana tomentosiformis]|uniref:uncharacterized protein n=1 Tax=Nicotiana tomentosiformis TaxID=4098 RepID=UPI00388CCBB4